MIATFFAFMDDTAPVATSFDELGGIGHIIHEASSFRQRYYTTWGLEDLGKAIHLYQGAVKTLLWHVDLCTEGAFASFG